ncbi:IS30 family transposase [Bradyrhizobium sp. i1.8.4]
MRDGRGQLTHRRSWTERPAVVEQRSRIGDWELDTIDNSHCKAVVVTMTERRSGLHLLAHSPDGTAQNVRNAIVHRLGKLGHVMHTLTAENGKEFADHRLIATALQADLYFADPDSAWQRGSNENANGLTRQYLPRHTDFSTITEERLRWIEQRLYDRPRKRLGFTTSLEVFLEELINSVANQSWIHHWIIRSHNPHLLMLGHPAQSAASRKRSLHIRAIYLRCREHSQRSHKVFEPLLGSLLCQAL